MKKVAQILAICLMVPFAVQAQKEFYEMRVYEMKFGVSRTPLQQYLKDAYIPAVKRNGARAVGVFEEMGKGNPYKLYVFTAYNSIQDYAEGFETLKKDQAFQEAKASYDALSPAAVPFKRIEVSTFLAFDGMPKLRMPSDSQKLFELRTYEGANEDAYLRKTAMFNDEELPLFDKTGLHSVFFGEMLSGNSVPALTYMLAFDDMEEREANWRTFLDHPERNRMKADPKYADTISNIIRIFLVPLDYSEL